MDWTGARRKPLAQPEAAQHTVGMTDGLTNIAIKPLGGMAGDMFAGACAAMWPDLVPKVLADVHAAGLPDAVEIGVDPVIVNGFAAKKFRVGQAGPVTPTGDYNAIVDRLIGAPLDQDVRNHALAILKILGEAEARVHGVSVDHVHFHELAGWDSIADVVAAAGFIARVDVRHWGVGTLPMGSGTVHTHHGLIPVPVPAVLEILDGYTFVDDGVPGERITPTGAAILRHLTTPDAPPVEGRLQASGFGAGDRRFKELANVVQLVAFQGATKTHEPLTELSFDIDDMTPEEIGTALERLRAAEGALDVTQTPQMGKKGRAIFLIRVLCQPEKAEAMIDLAFAETSTLGVRQANLTRTVLERRLHSTELGLVKLARRPGGATAKVESDALVETPSLGARRAQARTAEVDALDQAEEIAGE